MPHTTSAAKRLARARSAAQRNRTWVKQVKKQTRAVGRRADTAATPPRSATDVDGHGQEARPAPPPRGYIHKNKAARLKSRLAKKVNAAASEGLIGEPRGGSEGVKHYPLAAARGSPGALLMSSASLRDRFLGCLLGLAVGDAPRRPLRGADRHRHLLPVRPAGRRRRRTRAATTLYYTDDTQMMIGVAETLVEHGRIEQEPLARAFAANYHPDRGYGKGARRIIEAMQAGGDWRGVAESDLPRRVARQRGRDAGRPGRLALPRRPGRGVGAGPALGAADPPAPGRHRGGSGDGARRRARLPRPRQSTDGGS